MPFTLDTMPSQEDETDNPLEGVPAETYEDPQVPEGVAVPDPPEGAVVAAEAEPVVVEVKAEDAPAAEPAVAVEDKLAVPEPQGVTLVALQKAARLLGITETDPARLQEAIDAKETQITADRTASEEAAAKATQEAVKKRFITAAETTTKGRILAQMKAEGHTVEHPDGLDIWDRNSWEDPGYVDQLVNRYNELVASPEMKALFQATYTGAEHQYNQADEVFGKYTERVPAIEAIMKEYGTPHDMMDTVARHIDAAVKQRVSTNNSELAATRKEIETLRAQHSDHEKAIEAARDEGRKAAAAELGKLNPAASGSGMPSPSTGRPTYKPQGFGASFLASIPNANGNRAGRH